tara:strand:- start:106 stop:348 length:243 start_codon:yes stop_codon:yes gene_type:complete
MGLPPTKIEAVISNVSSTNSNRGRKEDEFSSKSSLSEVNKVSQNKSCYELTTEKDGGKRRIRFAVSLGDFLFYELFKNER